MYNQAIEAKLVNELGEYFYEKYFFKSSFNYIVGSNIINKKVYLFTCMNINLLPILIIDVDA